MGRFEKNGEREAWNGKFRMNNKMKEDDISVFEAIFKTHYSKLCFYANTILGNISVSEEIVSDIFTEIWEKRTKLEFNISTKAYLYKSVYNRCLNYIKHAKIENAYVKYLLKNQSKNLFSEIPSYAYDEKEISKEIKTAIDNLPEQCRNIFLLSRVQNKKYHEIAAILELSPKTVENQMVIALRKLREALKHLFTIIL
ncbi:MAG: RNA polymerase sigma-70 factor [Ginsengibacter sp.]